MAEKHLGPAFEIHGGGLDLVFPHHENEIAQSRGAGREFARIWMHNGMLRLGGEKMSKSLGNLVPLRDAVEEWGRETLLMLFLGAHWRKPMDFSDETLAAAKARAEGFREVFRNPSEAGGVVGRAGRRRSRTTSTRRRRWPSCTSGATTTSCGAGSSSSGSGRSPSGRGAGRAATSSPGSARTARAGGDFDEADRLRAEIEEAGWEVRDVAGDSGTSSSRSDDRRAGLRAPRGPRGAARPARGARALGDRARAECRGLAAARTAGPASRSSPSAS